MSDINWFPFLLLIFVIVLLYVGRGLVQALRYREHRTSTQKQSPERRFSTTVASSQNMRLESADTIDAWNKLTKREKQVARLAAHGKSDVEIADQLGISEKTVGNHLYRIFGKLEIRSRRELKYTLPDIVYKSRSPRNKDEEFP